MALTVEGTYNIGGILGEMREEYWQGIAKEQTEAKEILECLIFTLGGERYAFETRYASEVIRVPKLVRVPAAQEIILGIFNLRGEITAAMDIRPMLGLPLPDCSGSGRILVVKSEAFATGIIAESALGVQELCFESFEPAAAARSGGGRFVRGHFSGESGLTVLLDLEALLASPEILVGQA